MKRRSPNTSNGDTPATDVVVKNIATAGRSRLARKCKPDSRTAGKKAAPPALTKEEVLANVDLVPAGKKKRKVAAAVLDPADILGSALAGSFVGTRPSFGLQRLKYGFYDVPCEELARSLLGKVLVRRLDGRTLLKGRIVETECYPGGSDKASVSHNGRITESNVPVYMRPGTCFVYMTYGMYHCFNISSQDLKIVKRFYMTSRRILERDCHHGESGGSVAKSPYFSTASTLEAARRCKGNLNAANVEQLTDPQKGSIAKGEKFENEKLSPVKKKKKKKKRNKIGVFDPIEAIEPVVEDVELSVGLQRLEHDFYDVSCVDLAKALLGKVLVRRLDDGTLLKGRIVETESYLGGTDKASHSYNWKVTERNSPMYMKPGTCYVYLTYGIYHCFNISSQGAGAAVLVRAVDPLEGLERMMTLRQTQRKPRKSCASEGNPSDSKPSKPLKLHELCNGPAKLCMCLDVDKSGCNKRDLCGWDGMWVEEDHLSGRVKPHHIVTSTRIGINSAGTEWASKPLRFYVYGNRSVSRVDKDKEQELQVLFGLLPSS